MANETKYTSLAEMAADVDFVVHAVSVHDDLVAALKGIKDAWESLPGGTNYSPRVVEKWLINDMKPAIDAVRATIAKAEAQPKCPDRKRSVPSRHQ